MIPDINLDTKDGMKSIINDKYKDSKFFNHNIIQTFNDIAFTVTRVEFMIIISQHLNKQENVRHYQK